MSDVEIVDLEAVSGDAVRRFFQRIPEGDRTFFKENVLADGTVESWAGDKDRRRLVAVDDGDVVGYLALIPEIGWSSHVGEIRLVVDPDRRRGGLGRALARRGLISALELGLAKVYVEVVADQTAAVAMFQALGFEGEALLRDHVRDRSGELRDLVLLAHATGDNQAMFAATGIDEAIG